MAWGFTKETIDHLHSVVLFLVFRKKSVIKKYSHCQCKSHVNSRQVVCMLNHCHWKLHIKSSGLHAQPLSHIKSSGLHVRLANRNSAVHSRFGRLHNIHNCLHWACQCHRLPFIAVFMCLPWREISLENILPAITQTRFQKVRFMVNPCPLLFGLITITGRCENLTVPLTIKPPLLH